MPSGCVSSRNARMAQMFSSFQNRIITFCLFVMALFLPSLQRGAEAETLSFVLDAPAHRAREAEIIAGQLAEAGIRAEVQIWDKSELNAIAQKGYRQAYLTDWGSSFFDPYDLAVPKLSTGGRGNFSFYSNRRVDDLLNLAGSSTDAAQRKTAYREVQEIIHQQSPWAFGYTLTRFEGKSSLVEGYTPSLDGRINLHDVRLTEGDALLVVLSADSFLTLDPAAYRNRETETVVRNLFDALVTRTPEGKVVMELAESYETPDPLTYVFTLRQGPRFHNGEPVTAADVAFTFERVLNPYGLHGKPSPRRDLLGPVERVEVIAPDKVRFTLERPFPLLLQALAHFQIVPEKYMRKVGKEGFAGRPIGAGPFAFVEGSVDAEIVMERFEDYYGGSPEIPPLGPAPIKRAIFRPEPDAARRAAVLLDPIAAIVQDVPVDEIEAVRQKNHARILAVDGSRSYQLELNNALPPFNDIRIRKAVSFSIDWKAVLAQAYHDSGKPLATCFLPNGFGFDPELRPIGRDLSAARQLLQEAGYEAQPELRNGHLPERSAASSNE